jgi:hypothetical protein
MKNGKKLKLEDAHVTPRNIQEVQASKLGDAPEAPLLHRQKLGHLSTYYIFIASYSMRYSWNIFTFAFSFILFFCCNKWLDPNKFLLEEMYFVFHCQDYSSFHSYRSMSVLFF